MVVVVTQRHRGVELGTIENNSREEKGVQEPMASGFPFNLKWNRIRDMENVHM